MNKKNSNYIIYSLIILSVCFYAFLTGCKGSAGSDSVIINSPSTIISGDTPITPQSKNIPISNDGKVFKTSSPSGRLTIEAPEENTFNSNVILKITESPSVGNESSLLSIGSVIYAITATRDEVPINLLSHPLNLTFTNEQRLSGAENYYIGIKEINNNAWQFINVYTSNASLRTSLSSKNEFSYSLYKSNILIALFADAKNSLKNTSKVFDLLAGVSPIDISTKDSLYKEDLRVSLVLNGENLSGLTADKFIVKVAFLTSESRNPTLKVDDKIVSYQSGSSSNRYEAFGEGYAHYFQFTPLSTKFSSGFSPKITFDINLKDLPIKDFSNTFIVEISNADSNILPFAYSALLKFSKSDSGTATNTDTETETNTDTTTDTDTDTETNTDTNTDTDTNTNTNTNTGTNTDTDIKASIKLNSPAADFPITNSTIELEFSDDVPWTQADITRITIDNNAEISGCSYSNKILSLSLKNRLNYETTYNISVSNLFYAENNTFTITTEGKARVSLKSSAENFPVSGTPIELEFSKEIPWSIDNISKIAIDNDVTITGGQYFNKILSLSFSDKLNYSKKYNISVSGLEGVTDINQLSFTTKSLSVTPSISSATQNVAPNTDGLLTVLQPKFFINFGKEIASSTLATSHIKLNGEALPESCRITFDNASQTMTLVFTENLDYCINYEISLESYTDTDGAVINSFSPLKFKTTFPTEILGAGTQEDPFLIYSKSNLEKINKSTPVNYITGEYHFKQMDDIVITGEWTHIGDYSNRFNGKYDGNNKSISFIIDNNEEYYFGLFYYISSGTVSNLILKDCSVTGNGYVGLICSYLNDNGLIENIKIEGNNRINGNENTSYIGTIAGRAEYSTIRNVQITGNLTITQDANCSQGFRGGLVGYVSGYGNVISNCSVDSSEGLIRGAYYSGGLIGYCDSTTISKCYANINVEGNQYGIGGLVGKIYGGSISNSYSNSSVTVKGSDLSEIGGLAGSLSNINVNNSYSNSSITIEGNVGGLIGNLYGNLANSYAAGTINLNCTAASCVGATIGLLSNEDSLVSNTFSSVEISTAAGYSPSAPEHYVPSNSNIPLWWLYDDSYKFNASETNYISEGYIESLNWDSNIWNNLTEGALPTLKE